MCTLGAALLAGCGGDDDSPTPLPTTLTLVAPGTGTQQVGLALQFGHNAVDPDGKLSYAWAFGDGASSTEASPSHAFATAGTFEVALTVTNEAGENVRSSLTVDTAYLSLAQGLSCSGADQSGWCWLQPGPQPYAIADFFFVDTRTAYAAGAAGTILKTTDASRTWSRLPTSSSVDLSRLLFLDAQVGIAAARGGSMLRTADGGQSWAAQTVSTKLDAASMRQIGVSTLWAAGDYTLGGKWLSDSMITEDAGLTWRAYNANATQGGCDESSIEPTSSTRVWCYTTDRVNQPIFTSGDAGTSWNRIPFPAVEAGVVRYVESADFVGDGFAVVLANETRSDPYLVTRRLYRTADAGATWQITVPGAMDSHSKVSFIDERNGLIACRFARATDACTNMRTTDGGATWHVVAAPVHGAEEAFYSLRSNGPNLLVSGSVSGTEEVSADNGATWAAFVAREVAPSYRSVWFMNGLEGVATTSFGGMRRTSDGGKNWVDLAFPPATALCCAQIPGAETIHFRVKFSADGSLGWMAGDDGFLYRSTDKGVTWAASPGQSVLGSGDDRLPIRDFHFVDNLNGWLVKAPFDNESSLFRTRDGGISWEPVAAVTDSLHSVDFGDARHGVAVGNSGQAWVTADGGSTWAAKATGAPDRLLLVRFADPLTLVASGDVSGMVRSTDGGLTWRTIAQGMRRSGDIQFTGSGLGYLVDGSLYKTTDAGLTWQPVAANYAARGVHFIDPKTGWTVGEGGEVQVTALGGD